MIAKYLKRKERKSGIKAVAEEQEAEPSRGSVFEQPGDPLESD